MSESYIAILAWLGGACLCGGVPLVISAILFFTSRKRGQVGSALGTAKKTSTAAVRPDAGLVRLQGRIATQANAIDGSAENALVYLRLKVEVYERDEDSSGWRGLTDKARSTPFQLEDGTGAIWVNPEGLDKQLLGDGSVPDDNQVQAACILLGISPNSLRGQLRFRLWELRAGQTISIVGMAAQEQDRLLVRREQGQPFVVSPLTGEVLEATVSKQKKRAQTWALVLGIPGVILLVCGIGGALVSLIRVATAK